MGRDWSLCSSGLGSLLLVLNVAGCTVSLAERGGEAGDGSFDGATEGERDATGGRPSGPPAPAENSAAASGGAAGASETSSEPSPAGGSAPSPGGTSAGGASGAPATASHFEDCGAVETVPNDDRDSARDLGLDATFCVDEDDDEDWFYLDTPENGKAHVLQLDVEQSVHAWVSLNVYAGKDFSEIGGVTLEEGAKNSVYVTVGPGTRTLFRFTGYLDTSEGPIRVRTMVTPEDDPFEPNDAKENAASIELAAPISAQLLVPYTARGIGTSIDWYKAELEAGEHVLSVLSVPTEVYLGLEIFDSAGKSLFDDTAPNKGALFDARFELPANGTYYFGVYQYIAELPVMSHGAKADFLGSQYTFRLE